MKQQIIFALIMGGISTGIISCTLIVVNIGITQQFMQIWLKSWLIAYLIVIPILLIVAPKIQKLVSKIK